MGGTGWYFVVASLLACLASLATLEALASHSESWRSSKKSNGLSLSKSNSKDLSREMRFSRSSSKLGDLIHSDDSGDEGGDGGFGGEKDDSGLNAVNGDFEAKWKKSGQDEDWMPKDKQLKKAAATGGLGRGANPYLNILTDTIISIKEEDIESLEKGNSLKFEPAFGEKCDEKAYSTSVTETLLTRLRLKVNTKAPSPTEVSKLAGNKKISMGKLSALSTLAGAGSEIDMSAIAGALEEGGFISPQAEVEVGGNHQLVIGDVERRVSAGCRTRVVDITLHPSVMFADLIDVAMLNDSQNLPLASAEFEKRERDTVDGTSWLIPYFEFFNKYGTHFVRGASMGGTCRLDFKVQEDNLRETDWLDIVGSVEGQWKAGSKYKKDGKYELKIRDKEANLVIGSSDVDIVINGGDEGMDLKGKGSIPSIDEKKYFAWRKSIPSNLVMVAKELGLLCDMWIDGGDANRHKMRQAYQWAITRYAALARKMQRITTILKSLNNVAKSLAIIPKHIDRARRMGAVNSVDESYCTSAVVFHANYPQICRLRCFLFDEANQMGEVVFGIPPVAQSYNQCIDKCNSLWDSFSKDEHCKKYAVKSEVFQKPQSYDPIVKEGWIMKRSAGILHNRWQKRWARLEGTTLSLYHEDPKPAFDRGEAPHVKIISLRKTHGILNGFGNVKRFASRHLRKFLGRDKDPPSVFRLATSFRIFRLGGLTKEESQEWKIAIQSYQKMFSPPISWNTKVKATKTLQDYLIEDDDMVVGNQWVEEVETLEMPDEILALLNRSSSDEDDDVISLSDDDSGEEIDDSVEEMSLEEFLASSKPIKRVKKSKQKK